MGGNWPSICLYGSYKKAFVNMAQSFKLVMISDAPNPLGDSEAVAESALKNSTCLKDWLYCCLCSPLQWIKYLCAGWFCTEMSFNAVVMDIAIRLCLTNENARDADDGFGIKVWEMKLVPIAADAADVARKSRVMMSKIAFIMPPRTSALFLRQAKLRSVVPPLSFVSGTL